MRREGRKRFFYSSKLVEETFPSFPPADRFSSPESRREGRKSSLPPDLKSGESKHVGLGCSVGSKDVETKNDRGDSGES